MTMELPLQLSTVPVLVREVIFLKNHSKLFPPVMHMLYNQVYENLFLHLKTENGTTTFCSGPKTISNVTKTFANVSKSFSNVTKTFTNATKSFTNVINLFPNVYTTLTIVIITFSKYDYNYYNVTLF